MLSVGLALAAAATCAAAAATASTSAALSPVVALNEHVVSLDGQWSLRNDEGNVSISAQVPGQVHTDLMAQNGKQLVASSVMHCL